MLCILDPNTFDSFEPLSDEEAERISGGDGAGVITALGSGGDAGIIVAIGNGACDTPSHCGQTSSALGSNIGGGSVVTAPAAQQQ